jgi:uncharacterized protein (TIGR00730 family)
MSQVRAVCVYCGSSGKVADSYKAAAHELGIRLGSEGLRLVYGGGRVGLMGIVADATLSVGGEVIGIIPDHIQKLEVDHTGLTELHVVDSMHTRKRMMVERSDAFVILPGGLGTLDEAFEIITWRQLRLHDKPIVIVNIDGYWDPLKALLDHMMQAGFAQPTSGRLFRFVARIEEVLPALRGAPEPAQAAALGKL